MLKEFTFLTENLSNKAIRQHIRGVLSTFWSVLVLYFKQKAGLARVRDDKFKYNLKLVLNKFIFSNENLKRT